jgi:uncharacterized protein YkwD
VVVEKDNGQSGSVEIMSEKIIEPETATTGISVPEILIPAQKKVLAPVAKLPELIPSQMAGDALTRAGIIGQTNRQRQIFLGVGFDLKENSLLDLAAANKAKDMFDNQYFEHVSPAKLDAVYFVGLTGYEYIAIGENLAKGGYKNDAEVVRAWMDSPGHRENILKTGYKEIGVAAVYGTFAGQKTWLAVQIFTAPASACPRVDDNLAAQIESAKAALDKYDADLEIMLGKINQEKSGAISPQNYAAINQDIKNYNSQISQIKILHDSYKEKINLYNSQVTAHNSCLAAL